MTRNKEGVFRDWGLKTAGISGAVFTLYYFMMCPTGVTNQFLRLCLRQVSCRKVGMLEAEISALRWSCDGTPSRATQGTRKLGGAMPTERQTPESSIASPIRRRNKITRFETLN
jgi:hypothetical protein